jgi:hypothetical protein
MRTEAGTYCELHECLAADCSAARAGENRVYCQAHESDYYARHGRYAFGCREIGCPLPQAPGEDYCEEHLGGGSSNAQAPVELASDRFPVLTKVLQGTALVVVVAIASWALVAWVTPSDQQAAKPSAEPAPPPIGAEPLAEENEDVRELKRILDNTGYR